jgi:hypothetical protein
MLDVKDIVASARYRLADAQGVSFSDHEMIEALNECVTLLFSVLADRFSTLGVTKTPLVLEGGGPVLSAPLPSGFHSVRDITDNNGNSLQAATRFSGGSEYRIYGDRVEALVPVVMLEYYRIPRRAKSLADKLDVPGSLRLPLIGMVAALLSGGFADAQALAAQTARNAAGREISRFENVGPVQIWGGKA